MSADLWLVLALGLPFLASALSPAAERARHGTAAAIGASAGGASFVLVLGAWAAGGPVVAAIPWIPSAGIAFALRLDALALLFALLVTGVGAVVFAYAGTYMRGEEGLGRFFGYLAFFMGSMLGLVLAGDLIVLFLFWELTTISSFLLIGFHTEDPGSSSAAMKAVLITGLGGLALFVGFLAIAAVVGSFDMGAVLASGDAIRGSAWHGPVLALVVVAIAAKSAQVPLHIWLPDAMVAPTPVSAYLHSAAMVKAGIYVAARFLPALAGGAWEAVLLPLGLATMVLGGLLAVLSVDLKRILAYSTVSQLGLLAAAFGTGSVVGQEAGLLHLVNHAMFKASLFLVAGSVILATGVSDIRALGGLGRRMPVTATACGLAALAMAGLPPFGGFVSKDLFFEATLATGSAWPPLIAVVSGGITFAYSLHFFRHIFLGSAPGGPVKESLGLAVPALGLAAVALLLGPAPSLVAGVIGASIVYPATAPFAPSLLKVSLEAVGMSVASASIGLLLLWRYPAAVRLLERARRALGRGTFDGGYTAAYGASRGASRRLALLVQNGSLRRYTSFLVLFAVVVLLLPVPIPALEVPPLEDATGLVLTIVLLAMVAFAALAAFLPDALHAILSLSAMGFLLAMAFMLLHAPDLAMTQILVEMVFLAMFLIVLYKIPARTARVRRRPGPVDVALAIGTVLGVTYIVSVSFAVFYEPSIAYFYLRPDLFDLTGGRNVVNVIITDFRAFDTLGETIVVAIAALGVFALMRGWRDR